MASLTILHFTAQDLKDMYQVTYFKADTKTVFFFNQQYLEPAGKYGKNTSARQTWLFWKKNITCSYKYNEYNL